MAVYVMSDLHGNYEGFMSILEQIQFSEADELLLAPGGNSHSESARNDQFQPNRKSQCTRPPFKLFL